MSGLPLPDDAAAPGPELDAALDAVAAPPELEHAATSATMEKSANSRSGRSPRVRSFIEENSSTWCRSQPRRAADGRCSGLCRSEDGTSLRERKADILHEAGRSDQTACQRAPMVRGRVPGRS